MAPLIAELERHPGVIDNRNCLTGQHKDMVAPLIDLFGIRVDHDLNLMRENQTLEHITVSVLQEIGRMLREEKFDLLLVQGDTTTSMAAALAAFYAGVKIGHVEAGLRTFDKHHPYPEESNRRMIDAVADVFFAHSDKAKQHLLNEGIAESAIAVTGNTVIDALLDVSARPFEMAAATEAIPFDTKRIVLVTAHRRGFGGPFGRSAGLGRTRKGICRRHRTRLPVHESQRTCSRRQYSLTSQRALLDPLDYLPLVQLMKRSHLVLTDSGGLQEEAPSLGKPVLVLRKVTERQEGVEAGTLKLVGMDAADIVREASRLLDDPAAYQAMATRANPYGNGTASAQIVQKILADLEPAA
jgi:UDP-N-acetylglucosamine 2-epimerase